MSVNGEDNSKEQSKLEWGDVYLEVLNDKNKLDDMDNQKIQLCDLDRDKIPELIIYGIKNAKEYIANHRIHRVDDTRNIYITTVDISYNTDSEGNYDSEQEMTIIIKGYFLIK